MDRELSEAAALYAARDWEGALRSLDGVASTDQNRLDLAYLLGLCHARRGDWDDALLYLEQVVTGADEILRVYQCRLALAFAYAVTGRNRLAEYELGKLVAAGLESAQVLSALGYSAFAQGRSADAQAYYAKALELEADNPTALNGLGYVLACAGKDLDRALSCCRAAVEHSPGNAAYLDSLGWALFRVGRAEEAREAIAQALSLAPGESEILGHARALGGAGAGETTGIDGTEVTA